MWLTLIGVSDSTIGLVAAKEFPKAHFILIFSFCGVEQLFKRNYKIATYNNNLIFRGTYGTRGTIENRFMLHSIRYFRRIATAAELHSDIHSYTYLWIVGWKLWKTVVVTLNFIAKLFFPQTQYEMES